MNYKLTNFKMILRQEDRSYIPIDESNRDYKVYLIWLSEGNIPEPADDIENEQIIQMDSVLYS